MALAEGLVAFDAGWVALASGLVVLPVVLAAGFVLFATGLAF